METLVAASIVIQCRCPPGFLLALHVLFLKGDNGCARVWRSSLDIGVSSGKMKDIPGVLWISLGTRNELIGKPCASGRYTILIGLVESVGSVILALRGLVSCQSRLVGPFSCGHWGLQCITLGLELWQSCRVGVCDEILCKSGLESCLTGGEWLCSVLLCEQVVVVDNYVKRQVPDLICHQRVSLHCRHAIILAAICLPCVQVALNGSVGVGICWHGGSISTGGNGGDRVVIGLFLCNFSWKECLLLGNSTLSFIGTFSCIEISLELTKSSLRSTVCRLFCA